MPTRAAQALCGAAIGIALLVLLWALGLHVSAFEHADLSILRGFTDLSHRPHVGSVANRIAKLCNPSPYVYLCAAPLLVALRRRRGWLAVAIVAILLGANETTQLLKPLLHATRPALQHEGPSSLASGSWPSGHATAAMSLALCCVLAVPGRWRPWVAAAGSVFAVAVCYSFLSLQWHYPSDVIGGYLVAGTWTCLGVAAMLELGGRSAERQAAEARRLPWRDALAPPTMALLVAFGLAALVLLARPHQVVDYAHQHHAFVIGAAVIAGFALALATGLMLVVNRLGSDPAATAAPNPGSRRGRG